MRWNDVAVIAPVVAAAVGIYVVLLLKILQRRVDFLAMLISSRTKPPEGKEAA